MGRFFSKSTIFIVFQLFYKIECQNILKTLLKYTMVTPKLKDFVWRMLTNSQSQIKWWKLSELISHMKLNSMNSASKDCKSNLMKFQFFHKTGDKKISFLKGMPSTFFGIMYYVSLVVQKWIRDKFCKVEMKILIMHIM